MASFLSPVPFDAPEPVPWNWNPGATFLRSYYDAQENRRAQQEFEAGMEIERILLPSKIAKAEYEMKKFQLDSQLLEKIYRNQTAALDQSYSGINSALSGVRSGSSSGSNISGASNGGAGQQNQNNSIDWNAYGNTNQSDDSILLE